MYHLSQRRVEALLNNLPCLLYSGRYRFFAGTSQPTAKKGRKWRPPRLYHILVRPSCRRGAETERRKSRDVLKQRAVVGVRLEKARQRDIARIVFRFRENGVSIGASSMGVLGLRWCGYPSGLVERLLLRNSFPQPQPVRTLMFCIVIPGLDDDDIILFFVIYFSYQRLQMSPGRQNHSTVRTTGQPSLLPLIFPSRRPVYLTSEGTRVRALVWEDPTCRGATGPVSHNY
ncbi:uncharacterized protein [Globicephala melas]|uniref:uncharacterized protein n=1 Tax=Globicephala melas TaxID=9731 RepID=UPI0038731067